MKYPPGNDTFNEDTMNNTTPLTHTSDDTSNDRAPTVLVVGDHGAFCNLVWCQLAALGYRVLSASAGEEAQDVFLSHHPGDIDLLILDLQTPVIPGDSLVDWFQKQNPSAKVLLMTTHGHTAEPGKNIAFLQSPFPIETLGERVRDLLESTPGQQKAA
jgi:DNA-binding NtrC family response regulator